MTGPHSVINGVSPLTDDDIFLFKQGRHFRLYDKMGAHLLCVDGREGVHFAVWAPNAAQVSVMGDFNYWDRASHPLAARWDGSGIWEGFVPGLGPGATYKYWIKGPNGFEAEKGDPFAQAWETPPATASVVHADDYAWNDRRWMETRAGRNALDAPMSVYEVHLGSWKRMPSEGWRSLNYAELAEPLARYVRDMGFTHVELMPVMEHPFFGSWGYQTTGYFAPSRRFGPPQDFKLLMDVLHAHGIGVILDWVPSHFPTDGHALSYFDGTHLFEHADPRQGFHPDWKSFIFNYDRNEVRSYLISSALFWLDRYHADGLRLDAVASMLYLDYSRSNGQWVPNKYGGRENLAALQFVRELNEAVYGAYPDVQTVAEESTDWPMVSRPVYVGGLGFGMKWSMGWMHDTLDYLQHDPLYRKHHHNELTFSIMYAFTENFVLSLSHDEVVYGKGSLLGKMPGDPWQQFANLRLLYAYMWTHPGKKLLFMGSEFAQGPEWDHDGELRWDQLEYGEHRGVQSLVRDLNALLRAWPALFELDFDWQGFQWVDLTDWEQSIVSFLRKDRRGREVLCVFNFTPVAKTNYRIGAPRPGRWNEILNSDAEIYGGSGWGNMGGLNADDVPCHGHPWSLRLNLPPLGALILAPEDQSPRSRPGDSDDEAQRLYAATERRHESGE